MTSKTITFHLLVISFKTYACCHFIILIKTWGWLRLPYYGFDWGLTYLHDHLRVIFYLLNIVASLISLISCQYIPCSYLPISISHMLLFSNRNRLCWIFFGLKINILVPLQLSHSFPSITLFRDFLSLVTVILPLPPFFCPGFFCYFVLFNMP